MTMTGPPVERVSSSVMRPAPYSTAAEMDSWAGWFDPPSDAPSDAPPRRWKMALVTWAALYPILVGLVTALTPFAGGWPLPVVLLVTTGVMIPLMTWVIMPALTSRLGPWLRR